MLSIVILKYRAEREYRQCRKSLEKIKTPHEIITIDNNKNNQGYAKGNNLGAQKAKGEYLMILNPDTIVLPGSIDKLVDFLKINKDFSIVAPQLLDTNGKIYPYQGTGILTPWHGVWGLSFINRLILDKEYWLPKEVKIIPGTAFMMRKKDFLGFDENFFLYFEEADLCMRTPGKKVILKTAQIIHHWAKSTPSNVKPVFEQSRFYFFKKHYGVFWAVVVHLFCSVSKWTIVFIYSLLSVFYFLYNFRFFDDALWFYKSARGAPLLGITASLTWLHQGPLWTYLLKPALFFSNWSLISGQILTIFLWTCLIPTFYYLFFILFDKRTAQITTILLLLNPYTYKNAVTPYHTSPIPLFEVLFLLLLLKRKHFLSGLFLGFLYQLHLLTFIFWPIYPIFYLPLFGGRSPIGDGVMRFVFGFFLGILPFILTGPKQIPQLLIWVLRSALTGFRGANLTSEAYLMVLYVPALLVLGYIISKYVDRSGIDEK